MPQPIHLKFQFSDRTLAAATIRVETLNIGVFSGQQPQADPLPPSRQPAEGADGFLMRDMPIAGRLEALSRGGGLVRYVTSQYVHCYIDMSSDFETYRQKFSSKTRSTIARKVRKFGERTGGQLRWERYRTPAELERFFELAAELSSKTYQERLLDAGLPSSPAFRRAALDAARQDAVRAFLLFDGDKPVSYLYCPVESEVLVYAYLGYDPAYREHSVGTVLQWLALESLFEERRFRAFDFTEGQSDHKRLFATHEQLCANVLFLKPTLRAVLLVRLHRAFTRAVEAAGEALSRLGLKSRIRALLRFGRSAA